MAEPGGIDAAVARLREVVVSSVDDLVSADPADVALARERLVAAFDRVAEELRSFYALAAASASAFH